MMPRLGLRLHPRQPENGFKLLGIGFIDHGIPTSLEVWSITASPSNQSLCMLSDFNLCILCMLDLTLIILQKTYAFVPLIESYFFLFVHKSLHAY